MKFDVVLDHSGKRRFKRLTLNGKPCIELDGVLHPVNVGDYITHKENINGTLVVHCHKIVSITDTEVIGGPC